MAGTPLTNAATVTERFRRTNFGTLEIEALVNDPKSYTRPWNMKMIDKIVLDTELIDEVCLENESVRSTHESALTRATKIMMHTAARAVHSALPALQSQSNTEALGSEMALRRRSAGSCSLTAALFAGTTFFFSGARPPGEA